MTKREADDRARRHQRVAALGISPEDAEALRRISMTLRRWFERECGDGSWVIDRDRDGDPYLVRDSAGQQTRTPIADREAGARRRLATIMARYPTLTAYVQGDPRGPALYILTADQLVSEHDIDAIYTRGVAIA